MREEQELINDQYEIRQRLVGGMGYVYIVLDQVSKKLFAIKTLKDELLDHSIAKIRFEREARTWMNLGVHENVVHAISFHRGKQPLLILEYVDGLNLAQIMKFEPGGLSFPQVLHFAVQIADGLTFAHECNASDGGVGVVHRDLKPGNIMVTKTGIVKLIDFGLALVQDDSELTVSGAAMGTYSYMPPEQWNDSHSVTLKADLYSMGVVLYEMVAGMRPFPAKTPTEMMYQVMSINPEPLAIYRSNVDPDLAELIKQCLQKAPEDRPISARLITQELKEIQGRIASNSKSLAPPCPVCGYIANRELSHCILCETKTEKRSFQLEGTFRHCHCGYKIPAEFGFCTDCGERQQREETCGNCASTNPLEYQFCCQCGSQLSGN